MWKCESCQTENPKTASFCQTCGESASLSCHSGGNKKQAKTVIIQETKKKAIDSFYQKAQHDFVESNFSTLATFGAISLLISSLILLVGIILTLLSWKDGEWLIGFIQIASSILISIPGFILPTFIDFLLESKKEINQTRQELYVANQMNDETLTTLKEIATSLNTINMHHE